MENDSSHSGVRRPVRQLPSSRSDHFPKRRTHDNKVVDSTTTDDEWFDSSFRETSEQSNGTTRRKGVTRSKSGLSSRSAHRSSRIPPSRSKSSDSDLLGGSSHHHRVRRGVARTSSDLLGGNSHHNLGRHHQRQAPPRSLSDSKKYLDHMARREQMKALYRGESARNLDAPPLQRTLSRSKSKSSQSSRNLSSSNHLDVGPFSSMVLDSGLARKNSASSCSSRESHENGGDEAPTYNNNDDDGDPEWLEQRAGKQENIITLAHTMKEKAEEDRYQRRHMSKESKYNNYDSYDHGDDDDHDQPMAVKTKRNALKHLAHVTKSAAGTVAKGTVKGVAKGAKATGRVITGGKISSNNRHKVRDGEQGNYNYDATQLASRNQSSLVDRVSQMVETYQSTTDECEQRRGGMGNPAAMTQSSMRNVSVLMPTNLEGVRGEHWDV